MEKSRKRGADYTHVSHGFAPLYDKNANTLILGSFPSVKSREQGFFYGHPQNRFWRLLSDIYGEEYPNNLTGEKLLRFKKALILRHHLALYDVIEDCEIIGSSDSSIRNVKPADLLEILRNTAVRRIFVNGKTAEKYYIRYQEPLTGIKAQVLPSTSPANAVWHYEELLEEWRSQLLEGSRDVLQLGGHK